MEKPIDWLSPNASNRVFPPTDISGLPRLAKYGVFKGCAAMVCGRFYRGESVQGKQMVCASRGGTGRRNYNFWVDS